MLRGVLRSVKPGDHPPATARRGVESRVMGQDIEAGPGGALAVPDGDQVIAPLNALLATFTHRKLPVYATRDWHPPDHGSFAPQGGRWPPHCVKGTPGASLRADLEIPCDTVIVSKGTEA